MQDMVKDCWPECIRIRRVAYIYDMLLVIDIYLDFTVNIYQFFTTDDDSHHDFSPFSAITILSSRKHFSFRLLV